MQPLLGYWVNTGAAGGTIKLVRFGYVVDDHTSRMIRLKRIGSKVLSE